MSPVLTRLAAVVPSESSRIGYLLRLSRPRFWLYLAGPALVGAVYGADAAGEWLSVLTVALFGYFLLPANVFLYGVNDIFDADVDETNPKKAEREVRYRGAGWVVAAVIGSGVLALVFVPALPRVGVLALAGFLVLGTVYSAPPLRLKTTPGLDSLSNGLYVLPGVTTYTAVAGVVPPAAAIAGAWLWTMGMHTFSAIPDIDPDREAGIDTTATVLGAGRTYAYCGVVWLLAAVTFALVHPLWGALLGLYPLFVAGIALSSVSVDRAYWWFPFVNAAVGTLLTMGGLWGLVYGA